MIESVNWKLEYAPFQAFDVHIFQLTNQIME